MNKNEFDCSAFHGYSVTICQKWVKCISGSFSRWHTLTIPFPTPNIKINEWNRVISAILCSHYIHFDGRKKRRKKAGEFNAMWLDGCRNVHRLQMIASHTFALKFEIVGQCKSTCSKKSDVDFGILILRLVSWSLRAAKKKTKTIITTKVNYEYLWLQFLLPFSKWYFWTPENGFQFCVHMHTRRIIS